jgi:Cu/Ag efflux pump CusA
MAILPPNNAVFLTGNVVGDQKTLLFRTTSRQKDELLDVYQYSHHVIIPVATVFILVVMVLLLMVSKYFPCFATGVIITTAMAILFYILYVFLNDPLEVFE